MVARAGGYYGASFKGARGVTQGDPISPTIFNVVVDAVVRHHCEAPPVCLEEPTGLGSHAVSLQDPRHLDLSKASYAFCRSRNITYSTSSLKAASW